MQLCKLQPTQPEALDIFVVELVGEFDFSECDRLTETFAITKTAPLVFVDLAKASYLDSSALHCLVALRESSHKRGAGLVLLGAHGVVLQLLEVSRLDAVFDMRGSLCDIGMGSVVTRRIRLESRSLGDAGGGEPAPAGG